MSSRRGFLKLLGLGAAAPFVASIDPTPADPVKPVHYLRSGTNTLSSGENKLRRVPNPNSISIAQYLRKFGSPPRYVEEALRRNAAYVTQLDPDLEAKRSWSRSVKCQEQRKRNYERALEQYRRGDEVNAAQEAFAKLTGAYWFV